MRPVPIPEIAEALRSKIAASYASFTVPLVSVDLDEFWALDTRLSQVNVPSVVVEMAEADLTPTNRFGPIQSDFQFRLNYLSGVPAAGSKRSAFMTGLKELAQLFTGGQDLNTSITLTGTGIELIRVAPRKIVTSQELMPFNLCWGFVLVHVEINAYE